MKRSRHLRASADAWLDQDVPTSETTLLSDLENTGHQIPEPRRQTRSALGPQGGRRKGTACVRCRLQKIRCDDQTPSCGNCMRADHPCLRARGNPELDSYVQQLEGRIKQLERDLVQSKEQQRQNPQAHSSQEINDYPTTSPATHASGRPCELTNTASPASTQIGPHEPLAHNVGLLSLANSREPKYLGPSSGVVFGRLVFAAAPTAQGLPAFRADETRRRQQGKSNHYSSVPDAKDLHYFAEAYFEGYQALYPFLDQAAILHTIDKIFDDPELLNAADILPLLKSNAIGAIDYVQTLLVVALGAKSLESRLRTDFDAEGLYFTAVKHLEGLPVLETAGGVQILLLLTFASFSFENGFNAWYLLSTILASCLDLGLQRRSPQAASQNPSIQSLRSGIFWSAYSLDRTLCVVLGRPLTLRDEALDADFPDGSRSHDDNHNDNDRPVAALSYVSSIATQITPISIAATAVEEESPKELPRKRAKPASPPPYAAACFSFRFDQVTSEIKLMLHRVSQSSRRFPWPTDFPTWQVEVQSTCEKILVDMKMALGGQGGSARRQRLHDRSLQELELKFHQCIMLLHRPSPAIPQPNQQSLETCFSSACSTIKIYADLHRFANLPNTWLVAHALFVSGITMLFCVWTNRRIKESTTKYAFKKDCDACITLLKALGGTWSVAEDAGAKFERLVELTDKNWDKANDREHNNPRTRGGGTGGLSSYYDGVSQLATASQPITGALPLTTTGDDTMTSVPGLELADGSSGTFIRDMDFSDLLLGELGDMSTWFDLSWLNEAEANPAYPGIHQFD